VFNDMRQNLQALGTQIADIRTAARLRRAFDFLAGGYRWTANGEVNKHALTQVCRTQKSYGQTALAQFGG